MNEQSISIWIAAVAAMLTAGFTAVYAYLNYRMEGIMAKQFEANTRPYVIVDVFNYPGSPLLKLRIRNLGKSAAQKLRLGLDREFYQLGVPDDLHKLSSVHVFNMPVAVFAPGAELVFHLCSGLDIYKDSKFTPLEFDVTATYGYSGKEVSEVTHVDLNVFHRTALSPEPLIEELREIRKAIEKVSSRS